MQPSERFMGCVLGGALGDALGAPAEGLRTLAEVKAKYGPQGITTLVHYECPWQTIEQGGVGAITDDTTMAATTISAMALAHKQPARLQHITWQGYLQWGSRQEGGELLIAHLDPALGWPDEVKPFWFGCGAGRGTIAALSVGRMGTQGQPIEYDTEVRGKRVIGPNDGCGGMMRVAPLAFWPHEADKFALGCANAAITHGTPAAILATGAICELTSQVAQGHGLTAAFVAMSQRLSNLPDPDGQILAHLAAASWLAARTPPTAEQMDELPAKHVADNYFRATPVFMQVVYALGAAAQHGLGIKETLALAVNHRGDSDSVAAIVGNILGAAVGEPGLPVDWVNQLQMKQQLRALGALVYKG
jgi:ADP-ribosylglycohydrolase